MLALFAALSRTKVSAGEQECVDLNQWHVLVFALVMQAALSGSQMGFRVSDSLGRGSCGLDLGFDPHVA